MDALRIVGGHPALDLVNTVEPRLTGVQPERDHIATPAALLHWAQRTGLLDPTAAARTAEAWAAEPDLAQAELAGTLTLRTAVSSAIDAVLSHQHDETTQQAMQTVLQHAALALGRARLGEDPTSTHPAGLQTTQAPGHEITDHLALAALDLLEHADRARLGTCPPLEGGCGWVFLDTSKNHTRRWCSMEDCGTHAKSRRLTQRRRQQRHDHISQQP